MLVDAACPVCQTQKRALFFELLAVPIYCNLLWPTRAQAQTCPRGDIQLAFCDCCGLISNVAFDADQLGYSQAYENSLHYSPRFQAYADALAQRLVTQYALYDKAIVEVGCGKGDFLMSLCQLGNNRGTGFDNSYVPRPEHAVLQNRVSFVQDFYSARYADCPADFVCCRQVLEHVLDPAELLLPVRQAAGESTVFFEVPNALHTFQNLAIWDIIYEHCTYFTPSSLRYAFWRNGYHVQAVTEEFGGQFLGLVAQPTSDAIAAMPPALSELPALLANFKATFEQTIQTWQQEIAALREAGKRAVIWGAGSKGVTFLNLLNLQDEIDYAVDINPRKQGKYVAGTGQQIVPPDQMADYRPDVVIVMNPLYQAEIAQTLADMGLKPDLWCV
ncbi:MAG: methyltransferase domain-containing protein [Leptolyngbya sp. SIO4C1]|nr:methyltransferase domain-containing protein [Leptolyngbya sp. SIO4C1]